MPLSPTLHSPTLPTSTILQPQSSEAYLQQQRLEAAKGARADLASLQQALDRAKKAAEEAAGKLERAKKAEQDAQRGVEREKQREMLKDIKEKSKADKEKQKQVRCAGCCCGTVAVLVWLQLLQMLRVFAQGMRVRHARHPRLVQLSFTGF